MSATAEAADGHTQEAACLDCGTALVGPHCHGCGQPAHLHRTMGTALHDLLHGALHFEGRIWRTLPLLFRHPGRLTREYVDGRRTTYVGPVALFLFSVFLMFAALQIGSLFEAGPDAEVVRPSTSASVEVAGAPTGWTWADKVIAKATANPTLTFYKLQANSYKFSWLLIPLSVPFVWLLFAWRRGFGLYDHAVFVTYSLCFVTLLTVALWVLAWLGVPSGVRAAAFTLVPPIHIYRQLRGAYGLRRRSALWRAAALIVFIPVILGLFVLLQVVIGATG